jgi:molecular chaperone GrpE
MEQKIKETEEETTMSEQTQGFGDINADSDIPGNTHLSNEAGENALEKLQTELDEQKDKYIRLFAEFDNYTSLLDVLDDSERAEKQLQTSTDLEQIRKGIELVFSKLRNTLQAKGLKAMESISTDFDVEKHEAITEIPAPSDRLKDKVVDEVQKGYYLNDKIIRFAKVVVGK